MTCRRDAGDSSSAKPPRFWIGFASAGRRGNIAFGLDRLDEAEAAYREVQQEFLKHRVVYSVALVSLDLALLLSRQGRTGELKQLAAELMSVFSAQEVHREATARPRPLPARVRGGPGHRRAHRTARDASQENRMGFRRLKLAFSPFKISSSALDSISTRPTRLSAHRTRLPTASDLNLTPSERLRIH
jgi:hypothetical protein